MCRIDDIGLFKILFQRRGLAYSTSKPDWFSISLGVSPLGAFRYECLILYLTCTTHKGIWLRRLSDALFT